MTRYLFLLALGLTACSGSDEAADLPASEGPIEREIRVETLVVEPTAFDDVIEVTGVVEAQDDATLAAQSSGTITSLLPLGTRVGRGQTVAQLDAALSEAALRQAQAALEQARAQAAFASDNFERQQGLYADSIISALEFENVRTQRATALAAVAQAEAAVAQAQTQVRYSRVAAPFAGTVEEHLAQRGEQVGPGTPVVRLVSARDVQVTAGIPERYAGDIQQGDAVQVRMQMAGGETRTGRITFVGSAVNPQSRTFPVEIALANPDGRLKPSMTATVLVRREQIEGALVVPRSAVVREADGEVVYVVEGGSAQARRVVTGSSYGERVVVESGLGAGDEVIVLGQNNVAPGDRVAVAEQRRTIGAPASPVASPTD